jgi:lysine-specific demethylase 3
MSICHRFLQPNDGLVAKMAPLVTYTQVQGDKGKEKAPESNCSCSLSTPKGHILISTATDSSTPAHEGESGAAPKPQTGVSAPLQPELQFARCMSNRYRSDNFPRCVSCTRRWAGDTCRFQGIRFFLKDDQKNVVGISFIEGQKPDAPTMDFPVKWNVPLQPSHLRRTKVRKF